MAEALKDTVVNPTSSPYLIQCSGNKQQDYEELPSFSEIRFNISDPLSIELILKAVPGFKLILEKAKTVFSSEGVHVVLPSGLDNATLTLCTWLEFTVFDKHILLC